MPLTCPACTKELTAYRDDLTSLEIDSCFYCHGLWFDAKEIRRFFTAPKLYSKFRLPKHNFKIKVVEPPENRLCPRCPEKVLTVVEVGEFVVDECSSCKGVWLDSGEICKLVELAKAKKLKGRSETVKQAKRGSFDQGALGQASRTVALAFRALIPNKS